MNYSPKLKKVMEDIKKILKDNDVAASILLHDKAKDLNNPGHGEHHLYIEPSYSAAKFVTDHSGEQSIKIDLKRADFNSDEEFKEMTTNTVNMFAILHDMSLMHSNNLINIMDDIKQNIPFDNNPGTNTDHREINN